MESDARREQWEMSRVPLQAEEIHLTYPCRSTYRGKAGEMSRNRVLFRFTTQNTTHAQPWETNVRSLTIRILMSSSSERFFYSNCEIFALHSLYVFLAPKLHQWTI